MTLLKMSTENYWMTRAQNCSYSAHVRNSITTSNVFCGCAKSFSTKTNLHKKSYLKNFSYRKAATFGPRQLNWQKNIYAKWRGYLAKDRQVLH